MQRSLLAALMTTLLLAAVLPFSSAVGAADATSAQKQTDDVAEIRKLFADYAQLMNDKDTDAIAGRIYDIPVTFHQPNGDHLTYTDQASFALTWKRYIEAIEAKQGAVKLDITDIVPCFLNANTAVVTTKSVRTVLKENATALSGWFYLLNRKAGQWKISEISARDLDKPLSCP